MIKSSTDREDLRNADGTALPPVTASTPMPPVKPTKPEIRWIRDEQVITGPGGRPCTDEEKKALSGATVQVTTSGLGEKQLKLISDRFPDLHYLGNGVFESIVLPMSVEENYDHMSAIAEEMGDFIAEKDFPKDTPQYPLGADQHTKHVCMKELEARLHSKHEPLEFNNGHYIGVKVLRKYVKDGRIKMPYATHLAVAFPEATYMDRFMYIPLNDNTPFNSDIRLIAKEISIILDGEFGEEPVGVQPDQPWPRTEEDDKAFELADEHVAVGQGLTWDFNNPLASPDLGYFLTGRRSGNAPPRPGSEELARQSVIMHNLKKHEQTDVDQAIQILSKHVEQLNPTATEAEKDPAIAALGALHRVKKEAAKKKFHSRLKWFFSLLLLIGIGVAFYFYGSLLYTRGHYTTVMTCKVPFGDAEITGNRYSTFTTKSLLGYRVGSDVPEVETTEIKLPGENLTVLGFDPTTAKWWRVNYGKGEANTPKLRYTDMYWFVGDKDKTALVKYADFCK